MRALLLPSAVFMLGVTVLSGCDSPVNTPVDRLQSADARVEDTGVANTGVANTGVANTGVANTGVANTGVANTGVANTGVVNTGVVNTGERPASADPKEPSPGDIAKPAPAVERTTTPAAAEHTTATTATPPPKTDDKAQNDKTAAVNDEPENTKPANPIDVEYVSAEMVGAVVVRPHRALTSEFVRKLGIAPDLQRSVQAPFDPMQVERALLLLAPPADERSFPRTAGVVQFRDEQSLAKIRAEAPFNDLEEVAFGNKSYFRVKPFDFDEPEDTGDAQEDDGALENATPDESTDLASPDGRESKQQSDEEPVDDPVDDPAFEDGEDFVGEGVVNIDDPPQDPESFYFPNGSTMVFGPESLLTSMLTADNVDTPLTQKLLVIDADHDVIAVLEVDPLAQTIKALQEAPMLPQPVAMAIALSQNIHSTRLILDLSDDRLLELVIDTKDDEGAVQLSTIADGVIQGLRQHYLESKEAILNELPPAEGPGMVKALDELFEAIAINTVNRQVVLEIAKIRSWDQLPQLLQPMVAAARQQAGRAEIVNNAKHVAFGLHKYADVNQGFPASAAPINEGGPAVSWRVKLLPFLNEQALYDEYRADEPWDSEHNLTLVNKMPSVYGNTQNGNTSVLGFVSPDSFFRADQPLSYEDLDDGFSNTIMFVIAGDNKAVPWTKPVDLTPNPDDPIAVLGMIHEDLILAAFADGSVQGLPKTLAGKTFHALTTIAGGEEIDFDDLHR